MSTSEANPALQSCASRTSPDCENENDVLALASTAFDFCTPRQRAIMSKRLGLQEPQQTFEAIGRHYSVSKQRIKQIEQTIINDMKEHETWPAMLAVTIASILRDGGDTRLSHIAKTCPSLHRCADNPDTFIYILKSICGLDVDLLQIDDSVQLATVSQNKWNDATAKANHLLRQNAGNGWTEKMCQDKVKSLLPRANPVTQDLFWRHVSKNLHFHNHNDVKTLTGFAENSEQVVRRILENSDRPLHYEAIAKIALASGATYNQLSLLGAANLIGIQLAPGAYGLEKHIAIDPASLSQLAMEAEKIIFDGPIRRQWHTHELIKILSSRAIPKARAVTRFELNHALRKSGRLTWLKRMTWTQDPAATERIDIRKTILAILEEAGHPLHAEEIHKRLEQTRGISTHHQIAAVDPIIRVGPNVWGLNDRDVAIKRPDQKALADAAVECLHASGAGIHLNQAAERLPQYRHLTPQALFTIATLNPRLRISAGGQYLYLTEWGEHRGHRETGSSGSNT